jgi:hypothetical protein
LLLECHLLLLSLKSPPLLLLLERLLLLQAVNAHERTLEVQRELSFESVQQHGQPDVQRH